MISGTSALCVLHRPNEQFLTVAGVGNSKAVLVSQGSQRQMDISHRLSSKIMYSHYHICVCECTEYCKMSHSKNLRQSKNE